MSRTLVGVCSIAAALTLVGAAASAPAWHATGPPPGHTGGFGEPTCVTCHTGDDINAYGGRVSLVGLPDAYERARTYLLTVRLEMEETSIAGFQLTARFSGGAEWGRPAGELESIDGRTTVTLGESGQPYLHQTVPGSVVVTPDGSAWSFEWTAPTEGGPVSFNVAANSGNGDNSPLADLVFVEEWVLPPVG